MYLHTTTIRWSSHRAPGHPRNLVGIYQPMPSRGSAAQFLRPLARTNPPDTEVEVHTLPVHRGFPVQAKKKRSSLSLPSVSAASPIDVCMYSTYVGVENWLKRSSPPHVHIYPETEQTQLHKHLVCIQPLERFILRHYVCTLPTCSGTGARCSWHGAGCVPFSGERVSRPAFNPSIPPSGPADSGATRSPLASCSRRPRAPPPPIWPNRHAPSPDVVLLPSSTDTYSTCLPSYVGAKFLCVCVCVCVCVVCA